MCRRRNRRPRTGIPNSLGQLLGAEADGLLRAITKLQPTAGVVLLDGTPTNLSKTVQSNILVELSSDSSEAILHALIRAKERSGQRTANARTENNGVSDGS